MVVYSFFFSKGSPETSFSSGVGFKLSNIGVFTNVFPSSFLKSAPVVQQEPKGENKIPDSVEGNTQATTPVPMEPVKLPLTKGPYFIALGLVFVVFVVFELVHLRYETYIRIGLRRSYGNLQSYWTATKLWELKVVLYCYEAMGT